jgi:hypothetical protein
MTLKPQGAQVMIVRTVLATVLAIAANACITPRPETTPAGTEIHIGWIDLVPDSDSTECSVQRGGIRAAVRNLGTLAAADVEVGVVFAGEWHTGSLGAIPGQSTRFVDIPLDTLTVMPEGKFGPGFMVADHRGDVPERLETNNIAEFYCYVIR